eukprot:6491738-Amphidinium_carterae.2
MAASGCGEDTQSNASASHGCTVDMESILERALEEINTRLRRNKSKILPTLEIVRSDDSSLQAGLKRKASSENVDGSASRPPFASSYTKLQSLSTEFMCEIMAELSEGKLSKAELQLMERTSKTTARDLFWMSTFFTAETKWPRAAKDPDTLKQCCRVAHDKAGRILTTMEVMKPKRGVCLLDWQSHGWYRLLPADTELKTSVQHVSGESVTLQGLVINVGLPDFCLGKNEKELDAFVKLGPLPPMKLADFFEHRGKRFPSAFAAEGLARALTQMPAAAAATAADNLSQSPGSESSQSHVQPVQHVIPQHLLGRFNDAAQPAVAVAPATESNPMSAPAAPPPPPADEMAVPQNIVD